MSGHNGIRNKPSFQPCSNKDTEYPQSQGRDVGAVIEGKANLKGDALIASKVLLEP